MPNYLDFKGVNRMAYATSKAKNNEPVDCVETYGNRFVNCETHLGWDCCLVGTKDVEDVNDPSSVENNEPIDCYRLYGPKMADCERDWGWDCCFVDKYVDLEFDGESINATAPQINNKKKNDEPVDCFKTYGSKFADCETEWGWDCCFVGDEIDSNSNSATTTATTTTSYQGPDMCSQQFGSDFTDCGNGFGLDCCYIDDSKFLQHDQSGALKEDAKILKTFAQASNEKPVEDHGFKTCVEQYGDEFESCGMGFGLDCCYIDDGVFKHSHNMGMPGMHVGFLRWCFLIGAIAFAHRYRSNRRISATSKKGKTSLPMRKATRNDIELEALNPK